MDLENATDYRVQFILNPEQPEEPATTIMQDREGNIWIGTAFSGLYLFYDGEILKNLTPEWQKAWRLVGNTLNRMKIKTGDVFIEWRIKQLIAEGKIEVTGDIEKGWKDFDVKLSGGKKIEVSEAEEANS